MRLLAMHLLRVPLVLAMQCSLDRLLLGQSETCLSQETLHMPGKANRLRKVSLLYEPVVLGCRDFLLISSQGQLDMFLSKISTASPRNFAVWQH